MSIDRNVLIALKNKDRYNILRKFVPEGMMDDTTLSLLNWYDYYFKTYPEHHELSTDALMTLIKLRSGLEADQLAVIATVVSRLDDQIPQEIIKATANQLEELAFAGKAGALLSAYNNGDDIDITFELQNLSRTFRERMEKSEAKWCDEDPLTLLLEDEDDSGLQWTTFPQLAQNLKGLRSGHNVAIAAPTDQGKSSLLLRLAVDFAAQNVYKDRPILYLVNEGLSRVLTPRLYQTALGVPRSSLIEKAQKGTLLDEYANVVHRRDSIRLVDIHGLDTSKVAQIIEAHKPYLVITDMTGRIKAPTNKGGMNDTAELESVWNTMRELAAIQDFAHMGTIQVSYEGMDMLFPPLTALQNSKVGVQTTLDLILVMGALTDPSMEHLRGISTPKNKLIRQGAKKNSQLECWFDAELNKWSVGKES